MSGYNSCDMRSNIELRRRFYSRSTQARTPAALLLAATFLVGCIAKPSSPVPATAEAALGLGSFEVKERFKLDTGIRNDDGKPTGTTGIAVSADGRVALVMGTAKTGNVQVWDLEIRKKLYQYDNPVGSVLPVAISPDGKLGAFPTQTNPCIVLIDLTNGKEVRRLRKKRGGPLSFFMHGLAFTPKGDLVIVTSDEQIIGWDAATGEERFVWTETATVSALSGFFDDGNKIASGTEKGSIKIWDISTNKPAQTLVENGKEKIRNLFVSRDGKRLGTHESFGPITTWDLATGKVVNECRGDLGVWCSIFFLPGDRFVVYNGDWALFLQDTVTGAKKNFAERKDVRHCPVAVTPDGGMLVFGEDDAMISVWDLKSTP
jgi:WD40 repeat protein